MIKAVRKIVLTAIALVLCLVSLTGCFGEFRMPRGYSFSIHPPIIINGVDTFWPIGFLHQFPEINSGWHSEREFYVGGVYYLDFNFIFNEQNYTLRQGRIAVEPLYTGRSLVSMVVLADNIIYMELVANIDSSARGHTASTHFLYGNYIYYQITAQRVFRYLFHPTDADTIFKCNWFRINLSTGENESVSLENFVDRFRGIVQSIFGAEAEVEINPNFRVRK